MEKKGGECDEGRKDGSKGRRQVVGNKGKEGCEKKWNKKESVKEKR